MRSIALIALLAMANSEALAQARPFYDASGKSLGRSTTDSQGNVTTYDAAGKVIGRTQTDSQGTTTVYDPAGRNVGRFSTPTKRP